MVRSPVNSMQFNSLAMFSGVLKPNLEPCTAFPEQISRDLVSDGNVEPFSQLSDLARFMIETWEGLPPSFRDNSLNPISESVQYMSRILSQSYDLLTLCPQ